MHCIFTEFYGICIYEEIIFTFYSTDFLEYSLRLLWFREEIHHWLNAIHYTLHLYGILRNLHLWRDSLWECMFYIFFHGILRNFEEYSLWEWMFFLVCFDFLRRFIDLMHALYLYGILRNLHLWRDYFHFLQYGISRIFLALALISWGDSSLT